jgi:sterol desaturase/sphingolipid hydroxylase (fatty acid hydroxylase superfamily)
MQNLIAYAIPGFLLLIFIELAITTYDIAKPKITGKDAFASIGLGLGNFALGFLGKFITLFVYNWAYENRLFTLDFSWYIWIIAFFADDLSYYWFHRISHSVNYFWASHLVHHSSEKYNLTTAVRQTWTGTFSGAFLFWVWMPFVGFSPIMIMTLQSISLIYQFWIHTEVIHKLPKTIEFIFNTPSHHRVHHGTDLKYLDKNHAGILIIWDRMFGTFIEEDNRPKYGLTTNVKSYNPIYIAFFGWKQLAQNIKRGGLKHFVNYLIHPPGWSHDGSTKTTKQLRATKTSDS